MRAATHVVFFAVQVHTACLTWRWPVELAGFPTGGTHDKFL